MSNNSKFVSISIAGLFLTLSILPIINAEELIDTDKTLTLWMPGITQDNYFRQIQVSEEELQILKQNIYNTLNVINTTLLPNSSGFSTITYDEWQQISVKVCAFIDSIELIIDDFPDIDTTKLITKIVEGFFLPLPGFFRPKPIVSAGIGNTIIPFYDYETFLGRMIRPMLTRYQFGFTHIGGITRCRFTIGKYFIFNTRFCGMFINLGDILFEEKMGPTLYIGTVFTSRI